MIGREDFDCFGQRERSWWIGKPWRRIELTVHGEGEYREWEIVAGVGSSRLGWHFHVTLARSFNDYSDEPNQ